MVATRASSARDAAVAEVDRRRAALLDDVPHCAIVPEAPLQLVARPVHRGPELIEPLPSTPPSLAAIGVVQRPLGWLLARFCRQQGIVAELPARRLRFASGVLEAPDIDLD